MYANVTRDECGDIHAYLFRSDCGEKGITRQRDECRELVEARGWSLVDVYEDNDRSAYTGKPRPGYRQLLADIGSGLVDAVVAWHPDRLHRSPRELEEFIDIVEAADATVATVQGGEYDLSTASGRTNARIVGAVARGESEHKSERLRLKHEQLAREGKNGGGGHRPFGFEADRLTIRESEAVHVREAASRLLDGGTLYGIVSDWQARGIVTTTGKLWHSPVLKRMMSSARIAGLREHRGEVVGDAVWDAIIDPADHYALVQLFEDRHRTIGSPRSYLLTSGIAFCGLCGAKIVARPTGEKKRSYVCASGLNVEGCGKIRAMADTLEDFIRDAVVTAIDADLLHRLASEMAADEERSDALDEARKLQERLERLAADHYAEDILTRREFLAAREAIERRLEEVEGRIGVDTQARFIHNVDANLTDLTEAWNTAEMDWRRTLTSLVIEKVVIKPAVKGRNFFAPERVEIVWRV